MNGRECDVKTPDIILYRYTVSTLVDGDVGR